MKTYNVMIILNIDRSQVLLCHRIKPPYKGLLNLVGGKVEANENSEDAAYRELFEETSISRGDISLHHFMNLEYKLSDIKLEVFVGQLNKKIEVYGDENPLVWIDLNENFFDMSRFAGEGNIGHMIAQMKIYEHKLFTE